jgi:hypothetical protein
MIDVADAAAEAGVVTTIRQFVWQIAVNTNQ